MRDHTNKSVRQPMGEQMPRWMTPFWIVWGCLMVGFIAWVVAMSFKAKSGMSASAGVSPWWDPRAAGWIGGLAGAGGGVIGGVVGTLGGVIGSLSGAGRARRLVTALMNIVVISSIACVMLGVASMIVGVVAWLRGQPHWVYFPLIQIGGVLSLVFGGLAPGMIWMKNHTIPLRYEQQELRRMRAMDAG